MERYEREIRELLGNLELFVRNEHWTTRARRKIASLLSGFFAAIFRGPHGDSRYGANSEENVYQEGEGQEEYSRPTGGVGVYAPEVKTTAPRHQRLIGLYMSMTGTVLALIALLVSHNMPALARGISLLCLIPLFLGVILFLDESRTHQR